MSETELHDTQPTPVSGETQPSAPKDDKQADLKRWPFWLLALAVVLLIGIGVLGGYQSGISQRYAAQETQLGAQLQEQMALGLQALADGRYELAKQYFDFVIRHDPDYPGLQEAVTELLLKMNVTMTPTLTLTPHISPTPDLRGAEEIFNQALALLNARDWNGAISNLDMLRKLDPTYRAAEVDGMYFTALRMRGVEKLSPQTCAGANLEGGIYDLSLAERFGPLDALAESLRTYARFYIIGASYWDQNWQQAQYFFAQAMAGFPNMMDASCDTATKRWQYATIKYAEQLMAAGDYCGAEEQYAAALTVGTSLNETIFPTATMVNNRCNGTTGGGGGGASPQKTPTPTTEPQSTEPPTEETPPPESPTETPPSG